MRTKTLLTALAALAAGIITSNAQVYSANIVGYANVATPNPFVYYMLATPFAIGVSNGVNEVFGTNLPAQSTILTWDSVHQTFNTAVYDNTDPDGIGAGAPLWYQSDDFTPLTSLPKLPPGQGFFLNPNGPNVTNVWSGSVAINVGATNNMSLPNAFVYYMVGSAVPYSGAVSNASINLNNLPTQSTVLTWDATHQSFITTVYDNTDPDGIGAGAPLWYQSDDFTPTAPPTLSVGQGFFLNLQGSYTWTQSLSN